MIMHRTTTRRGQETMDMSRVSAMRLATVVAQGFRFVAGATGGGLWRQPFLWMVREARRERGPEDEF